MIAEKHLRARDKALRALTDASHSLDELATVAANGSKHPTAYPVASVVRRLNGEVASIRTQVERIYQ